MKLAAIYNIYDGLELLKGSIECVRDFVDIVIVIAQEHSNYGEYDPFVYPYCHYLKDLGLVDHIVKYSPYGNNPMACETQKRQIGINLAKREGSTHFVCMDADEYYLPNDMKSVCNERKVSDGGTVLRLQTYYKSPTLRLETPENYYVPFIHRLHRKTTTGVKNKYPFLVDPTRRINENNVKIIEGVYMHHFSYIRLDIKKKIKNSTARKNLEKKSWIYEEYDKAVSGSFLKLFERKLIQVDDIFNIDGKIKEYKAVYQALQGQSHEFG